MTTIAEPKKAARALKVSTPTMRVPVDETPEAAAERLFRAEMTRKRLVVEAIHCYADATGEPSHWRVRAKSPIGYKMIRPFRRDGARFVVGEPKAPDAGKLLYMLPALLASADAPVIVTEGERKADKLAALGIAATTSGSATSAAGADWTPLAGRDVFIWPDNDKPGQRYAGDVARTVQALGARVRVLDVAQLKLEDGGDAADWLAAHPEAAAADVWALPWAEPAGDAPAADRKVKAERPKAEREPIDSSKLLHQDYAGGRFSLHSSGVYHEAKDADGNLTRQQWLCSPISVLAMTRDERSNEWGRHLEWYDPDGKRHVWAMPMATLEGDGVELRRELAGRGLNITSSRSGRDLLLTYLKTWPTKRRARCVDKQGWHEGVYVTPDEAIGARDEVVVFQNTHCIEPALSEAGTVDEWRDTVGKLAAGNSRLIFVLGFAFAAPLAGIVGEDPGGKHIRGRSSGGKTTGLNVASSVFGNPRAYTRTWRGTANGLEATAAVHNDGLLVLDELSQADGNEVGAACYLLMNGMGKARAARNGTARAVQRWRVGVLSAGEESLSALAAKKGQKINVGQEVRLADIDADAGAGMGMFEELHGEATPAAFALRLRDATARAHGAVGIEWLRCLVRDRLTIQGFAAERMGQFVVDVVPEGAAGQVQRVARRFALVALAGEMATAYGLTGWSAGDSEAAAKKCFASWLDGFGGASNREDRDLFAQVRRFFEAHGASRFERTNATEDQRVINRAGFVRDDDDGKQQFLVMTESFKADVCAGRDYRSAQKVLIARGWIEADTDGRPTQKLRINALGTPTRVYVFTARVWEDGE